MTPKVSIITITYQAAALLGDTAGSILGQTCKNFEYLIVDGGSTDGTLDMIRDLEARCVASGISCRWISEPDKGIYDAMNKGLNLALGDYVWFVNAGDKIHEPGTLEKIWLTLPLIENEKETELPDFIYGETYIVDASGKIMGERRLKAPEHLHWKSFRMGMLVCHQAMLVRKSLAPSYDLRYHYSGDFDWTIRCLKKAGKIHNTHLVLAHFMEGGVSKKRMKASLKERFRIMAMNYGWLPTALRHLWFVCRAAWFKLLHGWI